LKPSLVFRGGKPKQNYVVTEVYNKTFIISVGSIVYGSLQFAMNELPNANSWTTVFDRYRILSVDVRFIPANVQMNVSPVTVNAPIFHTCVDFDDATAPTSVVQVQRYGTYAGTIATSGLRRHFVPRSASPQYITLVTSGYGEVDPSVWKDCAYDSIPHYGVKYALEAGTSSTDYRYDVMVTMKVEFAGQRG